MTDILERATLASLRERTDRDLIAIIDTALERGLDLLRVRGNGGAVGQRWAEAERVHAEATQLLRVVYGLNDSERLRLERKLAGLRSALDARSDTEAPQVRPAS